MYLNDWTNSPIEGVSGDGRTINLQLIPALTFLRKTLWMFISIAALSEMTHIFTYDINNLD
ncbi:hypothetical protein [Prochlorococcus marinus]|uniref:hypothetical protein n=1 Tax=Prochlorococcus marinus TaxID=1219 RepID=UPI0022B48F27|nr:hypothetical protein [Prochlorococcus marinus]